GAGIWRGHPECDIGCTGLQPPTHRGRAAPRTGRGTEAAPLPDPSRRGDQHARHEAVTPHDGLAPTQCVHFGRDAVADALGYHTSAPGPDLGIRPSGPGPWRGINPRGLSSSPTDKVRTYLARVPRAMGFLPGGLPIPWRVAAQGREHPDSGQPRLREHPRRSLRAGGSRGNHPTPQGGRGGPHGSQPLVEGEPPHPRMGRDQTSP
ncbi:hypothetical protein ALC60_00917, partial [Trachymyrmex zeteki]